MADVVKALLAAPVNAVLLVAGLAFLAVAVFRRITDRLDAGPKGRLFAGMAGVILIALSLYLSTQGPAPDSSAPATAAAGTSAAPAAAGYPIELPAGQVVKGEERTYTLLKIALDTHEIDRLALIFTIRMNNQSAYPTNFWSASFRLLADDVPVAPFNELNELVESNAAQEGTISFTIPAATRKAALQIEEFGPDAAALPIALPARP